MIKLYIKSLFKILKYYCITLSIKRNRNNIFILNTPEHGNLGDHAITLATQKFIKDNYPYFDIIEVTSMQYKRTKKVLKHKILKDNIIIINGGGYLGNLWPHENRRVEDIIDSYKNNKILIFPQTITISNDQQALDLKDSYSKHKNLYIALREENSYSLVVNKKLVPRDRIYLCPDLVLYLGPYKISKDRRGYLICFRDDKEKIITDSEENVIEEILKKKWGVNGERISTVIDKEIAPPDRKKEIEKMLSKFASTELVVTDRLHGMIFAAITETPCIVLDNISRKVSGVYRWIKNLDYIFFIDKTNSSCETIQKAIQNFFETNHERKYMRPDFIKIQEMMEKCLED